MQDLPCLNLPLPFPFVMFPRSIFAPVLRSSYFTKGPDLLPVPQRCPSTPTVRPGTLFSYVELQGKLGRGGGGSCVGERDVIGDHK